MPNPTLFDVVRGTLSRGGAVDTVAKHDARYRAADGGDDAQGASRFYDLVTDFYEYGWGQSFHFAPRLQGESLPASIARLERLIASRLKLRPGQRVLDAGCGIGGPLRSIARSHGVRVEGVTINAYQVERARARNLEQGLAERCSVVLGDFTQLPHADSTFDAAYSFEAICHAEPRERVLRELARVVKPGGLIAGTDWCLTERFDAADHEHEQIRRGIEEGNGIARMVTTKAFARAFAAAGLELLETCDLALEAPGEVSWYRPLQSDPFSLSGLRRTRVGRSLTTAMVTLLEATKLAPAGTRATAELLNRAADALVRGGELGIFTPLSFFLARVPAGRGEG
jgi:sterol 24-C-methyltransferase